ncbi:Uncharacterized protein Fot_39491 [Forsythia ovata]|uniref:Uncharacterized protein n=1 Tax=Forsythia ovata TaxID=205694 RepID=A0ABD1S6B6_9LAMI
MKSVKERRRIWRVEKRDNPALGKLYRVAVMAAITAEVMEVKENFMSRVCPKEGTYKDRTADVKGWISNERIIVGSRFRGTTSNITPDRYRHTRALQLKIEAIRRKNYNTPLSE